MSKYHIVEPKSFNISLNDRLIEMVLYTVNSEIFARVLFSRNFTNAVGRENNTLAKK